MQKTPQQTIDEIISSTWIGPQQLAKLVWNKAIQACQEHATTIGGDVDVYSIEKLKFNQPCNQ